MKFIRPMLPEFSQDSVRAEIRHQDAPGIDVRFKFSKGPLAAASDFLLPVCLLPAMTMQRVLKIPGKVSGRLMQSTKDIQRIFNAWDRKFRPLEIETEGQAQIQSAGKTACFFSGGLDSSYSLQKHLDEIDALIFVHGFDIPLAKQGLRQEASRAVQATARKLGKEVVEVETNLREFSDPWCAWGEEYHGAALASVALLLSAQFGKIYLPSSHTYQDSFPWGSHPKLDGLWGNGSMEIIHDGCEADRVQKSAALAGNDTLLANLRVCWENRGGAYNCCECEKCLRTMINLRVAGVLAQCKSFPKPLDLSRIASMNIDGNTKSFVEENLRAVKNAGNDPSLEEALKKALKGRWQDFFVLRRWR